jgi:hypothetical protein
MKSLIIVCTVLLICCACNKKNTSTETAANPPPATSPSEDTSVVIPDAPAAGKLRGEDFQVTKAWVSGNGLTLSAGKDKNYLEIRLVKMQANVSTWSPTTLYQPQKNPKGGNELYLNYRFQDKMTPQPRDLLMRVELGKASGGFLPGKIYLAFTNSPDTVISGTFTAFIPKDYQETMDYIRK